MLEKYNEWDYTHPRLLWGGIFIGCFVVAFLIAIGITTTAQSLVISNESARSVISTFNQILATILAIVISLTILAVEMTASKYSPRVIEIFKNNVSMWVFLFSYIISIAIGSIFLTFIDSTNFPISVTTGTIFLLALGIFLIFMLVPYVLSTLDFLNTTYILKHLSGLINPKIINPKIDPFQSIFDVIYGAIKNYDFTTMSQGLVLAESRLKEIVIQNPPNFDKQYLLFRFFDDMKRCGFLLLERKEEKYVFEIITRLLTISEWAVEKQDNIFLIQTIRAIEEVGTKSIEEHLISPAQHSITVLKELGETIQKIDGVRNKPGLIDNITQIINSLGTLGENATRNNEDRTAEYAIAAVRSIDVLSATSNVQFNNYPVCNNLQKIAQISIETKNLSVLHKVISELQSVSHRSITDAKIDDANHILEILKRIGKNSGQRWSGDELKQNKILRDIKDALEYSAYIAHEKKYDGIVANAIGYVTDLYILFPKGFTIFSSGLGERVQIKQIEYDCEYQSHYLHVFPGEDFPEDDEPVVPNYESIEIVVS